MAHAAGHEVIPLTADLTNRNALLNDILIAAPEAVVHLAGISFVGHLNNSEFYDVNTIGTDNLLAALVQAARPLHRVLIASSANVYGNCERSPIAETQTPAPVNHYAASKLAMEYIACTYSDRLPIIITRPFNYTGPGQPQSFLIPKLVDHFARRSSCIDLGNLDVQREYNDVNFVCQSYLHLLDCDDWFGHYNICTGIAYSIDDIVRRLTRLTGHHIKIRTHPAFVRVNEIRRLCGDPERVREVWRRQLVESHQLKNGWPSPDSIDETLARMLGAAARGDG
jgi:nucleoside-diphosphate-sugar epimerase